MEKRLKYKSLLEQFPDCPPNDYSEIGLEAFRWVHDMAKHDNDFKPNHLIKSPPERKFDDSDYMCKGNGLSFHDKFSSSLFIYKYWYNKGNLKRKKIFIEDKGDCIAALNLNLTDGIASLPDKDNYGHFTFHEYDSVDLKSKIIDIL